jgi:hypothetical protein
MRRASEGIGRRRSGYRLVTWFLVYLVLAGGIYPALYESQIPHVHIVIGGPPPGNWQNHPHANPLFLLFGSPDGSLDSSDDDGPTVATKADHAEAVGRVVSLYPSVPGVVLSLVTVTLLATVLATLAPPGLTSRFVLRQPRFRLVLIEGPTPPPPRCF